MIAPVNPMLWRVSNRASKRGKALADRHYSRQKIGSPQFVKPGRCLVFVTDDSKALWVTSWPFPEFVKHAWAGAWECSLFRSEGDDVLASVLIRQAVSATRAIYGEPPPLGFVSFIDPLKVEPVVRQRLPSFGYSWMKAGWEYVGRTEGGKLTFQLMPERMTPAANPLGYTPSLFAASEEGATKR